jgi:hypothetical protein
MKYFEIIIGDLNVGEEGSVCLGDLTHRDAGWRRIKYSSKQS